MNYIKIEGLSYDELVKVKATLENVIEDYDDGSDYKTKLQEDLWDVTDAINRYENQ